MGVNLNRVSCYVSANVVELTPQTKPTGRVSVGMTGFGLEVWKLMAARGITTQRALARAIDENTSTTVSHHAVRNYLFGRTAVPGSFVRTVSEALDLSEEEKQELAYAAIYAQEAAYVV